MSNRRGSNNIPLNNNFGYIPNVIGNKNTIKLEKDKNNNQEKKKSHSAAEERQKVKKR
jgi:hypothetical protein